LKINLDDAVIVFSEGRTKNPDNINFGVIEEEIRPKSGENYRMYAVRVFLSNNKAIHQVLEPKDIFRLAPVIIFPCYITTIKRELELDLCPGELLAAYLDDKTNQWLIIAQIANNLAAKVPLSSIVIPSIN